MASRATRLMLDNANLVKRVVFPLQILCVALVIQVGLHALAQSAVLDLVAGILGHLPTVKVVRQERMIDFVRWLAAMDQLACVS